MLLTGCPRIDHAISDPLHKAPKPQQAMGGHAAQFRFKQEISLKCCVDFRHTCMQQNTDADVSQRTRFD
jgi:hypothetical protein